VSAVKQLKQEGWVSWEHVKGADWQMISKVFLGEIYGSSDEWPVKFVK